MVDFFFRFAEEEDNADKHKHKEQHTMANGDSSGGRA